MACRNADTAVQNALSQPRHITLLLSSLAESGGETRYMTFSFRLDAL